MSKCLDPALLDALGKHDGMTSMQLVRTVGCGRATVHRFVCNYLGVAIYISGWVQYPTGGTPSPVFKLMVTGEEKDVESPAPSARAEWFRIRRAAIKAREESTPLPLPPKVAASTYTYTLHALMGVPQ